MTINDLRSKRAKVWNDAKSFLESRRPESGVLSAEDDAIYSKMEKEINDLGNEISRLERQEKIEKELSTPLNEPILNTIMTSGVMSGVSPLSSSLSLRSTKDYREDFVNHLKGRRMMHNVLSTTPDADGGYLVPEEFERQILQNLEEENVMRRLCKTITTNHERKIPVAATHSEATWTLENEAYTESNPTFRQTQIDAYKLTDLCRVSNELLQDSAFDIESYLLSEFSRAFGVAEEEAFIKGSGSGQPTGLFTTGDVGVECGASITVDDLISLVYSLKSPYRRNAKFLMNDATVSSLRKLKDSNGAYLWQPSVQAGVPDRLLGYEIYTSPYVPTLASGNKAIAFGDFSSYWISDRAGRSVQRLNELYATNGQIGYVATERLDGKLILTEGIKLLQCGK